MTRRRTRPRIGKTGCLFWTVILLVIIVVIVYRGKGSLRQTFSTLKKGLSGKEAVEEVEPEETTRLPEKGGTEQTEKEKAPSETVSKTMKEGTVKEKTPESTTPISEKPTSEQKKETIMKTEETPKPVEKKTPGVKIRTSNLYFVKFNQNDGSVRLVTVKRDVTYIDSPLTKTIHALIRGPDKKEKENGIINLIPEGTELISASIDNGRLTLDFNENFEANYSGREAILLQLSQVLLTSFEFPRVHSVRILIEGKKKQYITGEGIPLKALYTRQDVPQIK